MSACGIHYTDVQKKPVIYSNGNFDFYSVRPNTDRILVNNEHV